MKASSSFNSSSPSQSSKFAIFNNDRQLAIVKKCYDSLDSISIEKIMNDLMKSYYPFKRENLRLFFKEQHNRPIMAKYLNLRNRGIETDYKLLFSPEVIEFIVKDYISVCFMSKSKGRLFNEAIQIDTHNGVSKINIDVKFVQEVLLALAGSLKQLNESRKKMMTEEAAAGCSCCEKPFEEGEPMFRFSSPEQLNEFRKKKMTEEVASSKRARSEPSSTRKNDTVVKQTDDNETKGVDKNYNSKKIVIKNLNIYGTTTFNFK